MDFSTPPQQPMAPPPQYQPPQPPAQSPKPYRPESTTISTLKGIGQVVFEFVITLAIIFIISVIIRMYVLQPFMVEGSSMEPDFHNQEYLLAEKVTHYFDEYQRGQVIIFQSPNENINLIKRIIGLPGEKVAIDRGEITIYQNGSKTGTVLDENYTIHDSGENKKIDVTLKSDEYFVLGDNRPNSIDSRIFGPIKKSSIIGKVWVTAFPITELRIFSIPNYPNLVGWNIFYFTA